MFEDKIVMQAKHLIDQATLACSCYEVYAQLNEYRSEQNELLNESTGFFNITIRALINTIMMETAKLIDNYENNSFSCKTLLAQCKNNIHCIKDKPFTPTEIYEIGSRLNPSEYKTLGFSSFSEFIEKTEKDFEECQSIMTNLHKQRSKIYAHNDNKVINKSNEIISKYFVSFLDVKKCILTCVNFCNGILSYFENTTQIPCCVNNKDLDNLLGLAKIGMIYKRQYIKDKREGKLND